MFFAVETPLENFAVHGVHRRVAGQAMEIPIRSWYIEWRAEESAEYDFGIQGRVLK